MTIILVNRFIDNLIDRSIDKKIEKSNVVTSSAVAVSTLLNNLIAYWNMTSNTASVGGSNMTLDCAVDNVRFESAAPLINGQYFRSTTANTIATTVSTLNSFNWAGSFTLNFWFRITDNNANNIGGVGASVISLGLVNDAVSIDFNYSAGFGGYFTFGDFSAGVLGASYDGTNFVTLADNVWRMITLTKTGTTITGIVNADPSLNTVNTDTIAKNTTQNIYVRFGKGLVSAAQASYANIDEVGIWNRVLTNTELSSLYGGGNGRFYSSF